MYELAESTKRPKKPSPGARKDGKDTRQQLSVKVKRFKSLKEVEDAFDRIFARLFPGEAVDEEAFEAGEVEAQRPYPYQLAGWKEVGPTTRMVAEFCSYYKIGLRVLYQNSVIFKNDVSTRTGKASVLVYHIFGNHAYFYDDQYVKHGAAQLREGPCKIQMKLEDAVRLRTRFDEDNAVPYTDMEEYNFEAFMDQIKEQISKTYWCFQRNVKDIKQQLEEAGVALWTGLGARPEQLTLVRVPGSFEIPLAAKKLAASRRFDAIICLGAVIRGETPHFDYIAAEVTKGMAAVSLEFDLPVAYGIITADTVEQAINRAGVKAGNKGFEAAMAAIEMVNLLKNLSEINSPA
jgi:6,7-dimethyl-8-ribityllumazine synthase